MGNKNGGESSLHKALKRLFAGDAGRVEARIGRFVCDGVREDGTVVEIQLGSFAPLRRKVEQLSARHPVIILHPIVRAKEIRTFDAERRLLSRRPSPRKGSDWDLFNALVRAPSLALQKNVCVELAYIDVTETRVADGNGSWRRKGASIGGRDLAAYHGGTRFSRPEDYRRLIPFGAAETWTIRDLARAARIRRPLASKAAYVLSYLGLIQKAGRQKNANLWRIV